MEGKKEYMKQIKTILSFSLAMILLILFPIASVSFAAQGGIAVSDENAAEVETAIRAYIEEKKDKHAAISVTAFSGTDDICTVISGYADKSKDVKADENTVYEWGSVTKLLTWVSAMQLYEQGRLDLNEDIRTYLPNGFLTNLSYDKPVTMLHLMNHTAGFQENLWEQETPDISRIISLDKALKNTAPAQVNEPGKVASYSNWGAALAGYIVERISGQSFSDYVNEHIFRPLGMEHTSVSPDCSDNEYVAASRKKIHSYTYYDGEEDMGECRSYILLYPAGAATGTIQDMATFAKAFLCESAECPLFEKPETLKEMLTPSSHNSDGSVKMCHGIFFGDFGDGVYGHGGATVGFSSDLQLDLANKTGYVMMTNSHGAFSSDEITEKLYGTFEVVETKEFTPVDLSGHYSMGRSMFGAGVLKLVGFFEDDLYLENVGNNTYAAYDGAVTFTQVSDTAVKAKMPSGKVNNFIIRKGADGKIEALESYHAIEYTKVSDVVYTFKLVSIYALAAANALLVLLGIVNLVMLIKLRKTELKRFKLFETLGCLCTIVIDLAAASIRFLGLPFMTENYLGIPCIALSIAALAGTGLLVSCLFQKKKPKFKVLIITELALSVIVVAGICYWKMYQFWGF